MSSDYASNPAAAHRVETREATTVRKPAPAPRGTAAPAKLSSVLEGLLAQKVTESERESGAWGRFDRAGTVKEALEAWLQPAAGEKLDKDLVARTLSRDVARLDALLTKQVNAVLHHPRFQQLESSWRGLRYLVEQTNDDEERRVKIRVLHLPWRDLARDVTQAVEFDQSQLFRKVYNDEFGTPGGEPFGLLIGDYYLRHKPGPEHPIDDLEILRGVSQVAAAAFAPFVTSIHPSFLGMDDFTEFDRLPNLSRSFEQLEYLKWRSFRDSEDSRFVGLTMPRVLMRSPYQDNDGRSDGFRFQEDAEGPNRQGYLWGNAAYAFGEVAIRAFVDTGWLADIRGFQRGVAGGGLVSGLPSQSFATDHVGVAVKVSTDGIVTDHQDTELGDLGFVPLCPAKDTEYSVFYSNQSAQKPKKYDEPGATVNARMSSMLQYMLCVSRFAHFVKVLGRDKIGVYNDPDELERSLHDWLQRYVTSDDDASPESKAEYPLREAGVTVKEIPGKPGCYQSVVHLRPHYQLDSMSAGIKLRTELAPPNR